MKNKLVHLNTEYIKGFIEAMIIQMEHCLGPFISDISSYEIVVTKVKGKEEMLIQIHYSIIGDGRANLKSYFDLKENDTNENFEFKSETAIKEIIDTIAEFNREH